MNKNFSFKLHFPILVFGIAAPFLFPGLQLQIATLWVMVLFALTWDIMGGQMGYNSLGNIMFFGIGMYTSVLFQVGQFAEIGAYTAAHGGDDFTFTNAQYYQGLVIGIIMSGVVAAIAAAALGWTVFGLRGPYFAIGTLGMAIAAGELMGTWEWVGAGSGISVPVFPGSAEARSLLFYFLCFGAAVLTFVVLQWVYKTRFGLAVNAIRDDEEKAEAMGIHTVRYKTVAWAISAFFVGISGALFGNITGIIEPLEVAFPTVTFGIFMVAMTLLGGKGTLWGPVLGAVLFHTLKEVTWTYFLGWQWVALGVLIIINVVFFQQGIMGWLMEKFPEKFGIVVENKEATR
ncbi:MAG: branched-chain amino acid ABC transporter permease [Rhodospirillales bacterium]|nr:branched-chain amino acid ABC transporter permease [Rhodospirillales bacterium]MBO6788013.1 branched-chain amino acid ABC transporter permease [Rhodospirillales bacterium]